MSHSGSFLDTEWSPKHHPEAIQSEETGVAPEHYQGGPENLSFIFCYHKLRNYNFNVWIGGNTHWYLGSIWSKGLSSDLHRQSMCSSPLSNPSPKHFSSFLSFFLSHFPLLSLPYSMETINLVSIHMIWHILGISYSM